MVFFFPRIVLIWKTIWFVLHGDTTFPIILEWKVCVSVGEQGLIRLNMMHCILFQEQHLFKKENCLHFFFGFTFLYSTNGYMHKVGGDWGKMCHLLYRKLCRIDHETFTWEIQCCFNATNSIHFLHGMWGKVCHWALLPNSGNTITNCLKGVSLPSLVWIIKLLYY